MAGGSVVKVFAVGFARSNGHEAKVGFKKVGFLEQPADAFVDGKRGPSEMSDGGKGFVGTPVTHVVTAVDVVEEIQRTIGDLDADDGFEVFKVMHVDNHESRFAAISQKRDEFTGGNKLRVNRNDSAGFVRKMLSMRVQLSGAHARKVGDADLDESLYLFGNGHVVSIDK
jgi:hypothetical protein